MDRQKDRPCPRCFQANNNNYKGHMPKNVFTFDHYSPTNNILKVFGGKTKTITNLIN